MRDEAFSPLEDAFFAAGDACAHQTEESIDEAEAYEPANEGELRMRLGALKARLRPTIELCRTRLILQTRLLQFRLAVAFSSCAEHAVRVASSGTPVHGLLRGMVRHASIPRLPLLPELVAVRSPALARASLYVLVFTAATFPAAAVLAATGAL